MTIAQILAITIPFSAAWGFVKIYKTIKQFQIERHKADIDLQLAKYSNDFELEKRKIDLRSLELINGFLELRSNPGDYEAIQKIGKVCDRLDPA